MPVPDCTPSKSSFTPLSTAWAPLRFTAPWCHWKTAQLKNSSQRKPLSPPFSHLPSKNTLHVPRFAFLWVKNNIEASANISVPDMSCLNDQPAPQPKHARSLSLQKKKKNPDGSRGAFYEYAPVWSCHCTQTVSDSGALAFLLIALISWKKKNFKMHRFT